jgi:hypothetical protein
MTRLLLALLLLASPALAAPNATFDAFNGKWIYASGAKARDAAVEELVAEVNGLLRNKVRSELKEGTEIPDWVDMHLQVDSCQLTVEADMNPEVSSELGGDPVHFVDAHGRTTKVQRVPKSDAIRERGERGLGKREATYRVQNDALVIDVKLTHPAMPEPLLYRLTYKRA